MQLVHGDSHWHILQGKSQMQWRIGKTDVAENVPIEILLAKYSNLNTLDLQCGGRRVFL